jgi:site-specific recombinase XerD
VARVSDRALVDRFLSDASLSKATRRAYRSDVAEFSSWLHAEGLELDDVETSTLAAYAAALAAARPGREPRKLAPATIARKLAAVRALLRFALGPGRVPEGSFAPRKRRSLPDAPKPDEVNAVLAAIEGDDPLALRNRALVELVYSAGLRSAEAVGLDLGDVDFE